ncbi:MAG: hypothetical protein HEP71_03210 [Roseivirga sp.]|nr:hypothetical protein [Roseivirga sp.]
MTLSNKWLEPDIRWEKTGTPDFESFLNTYHIAGRFHAAVPKDVVDAYETVEYLQVHAWYHWPMYTEAFNKLTFLLEMAIKKKATQIGLDLTFTTRGGQVRNKNLDSLIREVMAVHYSQVRQAKMLALKEVRNHTAHPRSHNFYGGPMIQDAFKPFINMVNELFLDKEPQLPTHQQLLSQIEAFKGQCLVLDDGTQRQLVYQFRLLDSFGGAATSLYLVDAERILSDPKKVLDQTPVNRPSTFVATSLEVGDDSISFTNKADQKGFTLTPTDKAENTNRYQAFHRLLSDRNYKNGQFYQGFYTKFLNEAIEGFRYQWFWE